MAINVVLVNSEQSNVANTIEIFYTSPPTGEGTIITAFTATNNTGSNRTYKAYIFDSTGAVLPAVAPLRIIIRNRFDLGSGVINQFIPPGGTLRMESDLASSIVFRVSGKEL